MAKNVFFTGQVPTAADFNSLSQDANMLATGGTVDNTVIGATTPAAGTFTEASLAAISQSLHIGAVVKAIVYDTSKDSDGGAWRKRCSDKSWYTETLGGDRWIGQAATISAAWTAAGSATGAVFQASATAGPITSGKYYSADSNTTATEVFRGIGREFPAVAGIVAESGRVVIYDLSQAAAPMWMVFTLASSNYISTNAGATSIAFVNGVMTTGLTSSGLSIISFISDGGYMVYINAPNTGPCFGRISSRNAGLSFGVGTKYGPIVATTVNDVAITVLDTAVIDPATGLPQVTIACATAGGVSVILDSGTVVNSTLTSAFYGVVFGKNYLLAHPGTGGTLVYYTSAYTSAGFAFSSYTTTTIPAIATASSVTYGLAQAGSTSVFGKSHGLSLIKENPATPTKGMVAYITATTSTASGYNTGFMVGDIRLATLADSTAETVTGSGELVTNGTFDTDTGWIKGTGWTIAGGVAVATAAALGTTLGGTTFATVVGKTYVVSFDVPTCSGGAVILYAYSGAANIGNSPTMTGTGSALFSFVATTTTTYLYFYSASASALTATFDNISGKLATPDRSVKNKGLVINGSLSKTAVASGASLVAYSGFADGAAYLQQPYNSDLDFGTGDFCYQWWENTNATGQLYRLARTGSTNSFICYSGVGLVYAFVLGATAVTTTVALTSGWKLITALRSSGVFKVYTNDVLVYSVANTNDVSVSDAVLRVGTNGGTPVWSGAQMTLLRISATAPTADQIAHIYRTELPLFQANAKCIIDGTSTAVTALAYDDTTDLLHVGTSYGRSTFKDLLRVDTDVTSTGALTSLSASQCVIITGGTSGKVYVPAMLLRDELRRKDEAKKALGRVVVGKNFTATSGQTVFVCTAGYDVRFVYVNGLLKTLTTDYTVATDGFQYTVTTTSGVPINQIVTVMMTRS